MWCVRTGRISAGGRVHLQILALQLRGSKPALCTLDCGWSRGASIIEQMEAWIMGLLATLAVPRVGLAAVFIISLVSATLLPLGSEFAVIGVVKLDEALFWPAVLVATVGNTVGGAISWWMGYGIERAYERISHHKPHEAKALRWLERFGPRACLLSWLPAVGDPLCAVAGWLRLPFWPCVAYMAVGKFLRYLTMTAALLWWFPGQITPAAG
jgi:membrane protein YqaA with SNARE-associated domain